LPFLLPNHFLKFSHFSFPIPPKINLAIRCISKITGSLTFY
jgi:hypothetical protein